MKAGALRVVRVKANDGEATTYQGGGEPEVRRIEIILIHIFGVRGLSRPSLPMGEKSPHN
jgi:hypothetical protein